MTSSRGSGLLTPALEPPNLPNFKGCFLSFRAEVHAAVQLVGRKSLFRLGDRPSGQHLFQEIYVMLASCRPISFQRRDTRWEDGD